MDFTTREDIEAPIDYVFDQVTDFASFERSIMRRGGDVERIVDAPEPTVGMKWRLKFLLRGAERMVDVEVTELDRPNAITFQMTSKSVDGVLKVELVALSRARTRLNIRADTVAKSIPAKLAFQSLKFARNKPQSRFKAFVTGFAEDVEARYRD